MRRLALLVAALFAAGLALAGAAAAHVTVTAPGATRGGGDQEITFRVPVEKDATTTALTIQLPTSTPIASVDVAQKPGWTHTEKSVTLTTPIKTDDGDITTAVSQVTWTAQKGEGLQPGEYGTFTILAGQLPDAASLTFPALQTYSDGSVVRWVEKQAPGSADEPEHPAPVLDLAASSASSADSAGSSATPSAAPSVSARPAASSTSTTGPTVLAIVALVVAAGALGLAVVGRARRHSA